MNVKALAAKAGRTWINWTSFKLGAVFGAVVMALWMGFITWSFNALDGRQATEQLRAWAKQVGRP